MIKKSNYPSMRITPLFFRMEIKKVCGVMHVLGWFRRVFGLAINKDKTNVIKIGTLR